VTLIVSSNKNLPLETPSLAGSKPVGLKVPEGFAGFPAVPVHWPGFSVNPLGVRADRVAGMSAT
jgi:hypothetical protein